MTHRPNAIKTNSTLQRARGTLVRAFTHGDESGGEVFADVGNNSEVRTQTYQANAGPNFRAVPINNGEPHQVETSRHEDTGSRIHSSDSDLSNDSHLGNATASTGTISRSLSLDSDLSLATANTDTSSRRLDSDLSRATARIIDGSAHIIDGSVRPTSSMVGLTEVSATQSSNEVSAITAQQRDGSKANFVAINAGKCEQPITTETECRDAFAELFLGRKDAVFRGSGSSSIYPGGCFFMYSPHDTPEEPLGLGGYFNPDSQRPDQCGHPVIVAEIVWYHTPCICKDSADVPEVKKPISPASVPLQKPEGTAKKEWSMTDIECLRRTVAAHQAAKIATWQERKNACDCKSLGPGFQPCDDASYCPTFLLTPGGPPTCCISGPVTVDDKTGKVKTCTGSSVMRKCPEKAADNLKKAEDLKTPTACSTTDLMTAGQVAQQEATTACSNTVQATGV